jgi:hypothetical protein
MLVDGDSSGRVARQHIHKTLGHALLLHGGPDVGRDVKQRDACAAPGRCSSMAVACEFEAAIK